MMTSAIVALGVPDSVVVVEEKGVAIARVEVDGEVAARGQVAVHGSDAIFDRITVSPQFRRQGWGRRVMARLTSWAADTGSTTGILMASVDGRRLYESLGWQDAGPVATFRGRTR